MLNGHLAPFMINPRRYKMAIRKRLTRQNKISKSRNQKVVLELYEATHGHTKMNINKYRRFASKSKKKKLL